MKIGLVTQNCLWNFGSTLQAYALCEKVGALGHEIKILNYWPDDFYTLYNRKYLPLCGPLGIVPNKILHNAMTALHSKEIDVSRKSFTDFKLKRMNFTDRLYFSSEDLRESVQDFDAFMTGSDQAWSPKFIDDARFLNFTRGSGKKTISYAPSLGVTHIDDKNSIKRIKLLLENVQFLSSREEIGSEILRDITSRDVETVLDPTLLHPRGFWETIAGDSPLIDCKYILAYVVHPNRNVKKIVNSIRRTFGLPVIMLVGSMSAAFYMDADKIYYAAGPAEFLNLILYAERTFMSSFHGIVFSLIFGKCCHAMMSRSDDSRMSDIFKRMGIKNGIITDETDLGNLEPTDYSRMDDLLALEVKKSEDYLKKALA